MLGKEKLAVFRAAFKKAHHGRCSMPNRFDFSRITSFEFYTDGMRGGHSARIFFRKNLLGEIFMEFHSGTDHDSGHGLILSDGTLFRLPTGQDLGGEILWREMRRSPPSSTENDSTPRETDDSVFAQALPVIPPTDHRASYW